MALFIQDACPKSLIGRRIEVLWTDYDEQGAFSCVRMLDGEPAEYGDPDGFTVVCTAFGSSQPVQVRAHGPDNRLCRWSHQR